MHRTQYFVINLTLIFISFALYWDEKKCVLKRQCQQRVQSLRHTGGGVDMLPELSQLDHRLVAVMGGFSFATGDRGLAVDPQQCKFF